MRYNVTEGESIELFKNTYYCDTIQGIEDALAACSTNGGGSVYVASGTYSFTDNLFIDSNTYMKLAKDAIMIRGVDTLNNIIRNVESSSGGYNAIENVTIEGGIWDANSAYTTGCTLLAIQHGTNIKVLNAIFKNVQTWHCVEFNAIYNGEIRGCYFYDTEKNVSNAEQIQLDGAINTGTFPWETADSVPVGTRSFDGTMCNKITITDCTFLDGSTGIGTHTTNYPKVHENITITNNHFNTLTNYATKLIGYREVIISNNTIDLCPSIGVFIGNNSKSVKSVTSITRSTSTATVIATSHGFVNGATVTISGADQSEYNGVFVITVVDPDTFTYTVSGTPVTPATGTIEATYSYTTEGFVVSSNLFTAAQNNDARGIWVLGDSLGYNTMKDVTITGNVIRETNTGFDIGIITEHVDNVVISSNDIKGYKDSGAGIDIYQCQYFNVIGNIVNSSFATTDDRALLLGASSGTSTDTSNGMITNNMFSAYLLRVYDRSSVTLDYEADITLSSGFIELTGFPCKSISTGNSVSLSGIVIEDTGDLSGSTFGTIVEEHRPSTDRYFIAVGYTGAGNPDVDSPLSVYCKVATDGSLSVKSTGAGTIPLDSITYNKV